MDDRADVTMRGAAPPEGIRTAEHPVLEQLERAGREARWHMSRHTLELAIQAIGATAGGRTSGGASGKGRRRKRHKRLL